MITLKKIEAMQDRVCARKTANVLHEEALRLARGQDVSLGYVRSLCHVFTLPKVRALLPSGEAARADLLCDRIGKEEGRDLAFLLSDLSSLLLAALGAEPSDWDFTDDAGFLDPSKRRIADHYLVLDRLRSPYNVGAVFRSADSFGIKEILLVEGTASPLHPRAARTSRGTVDTVPWRFVSEEEAAAFIASMPSFALELGGEDIHSYAFPERGACVLGSEEMGVSPALLAAVPARVSIPLYGTKGSLNVSVAAGILLAFWPL